MMLSYCLVNFRCFRTLNNLFIMLLTMVCNTEPLVGRSGFHLFNLLWTHFRVSFNVYVSILYCYVIDFTELDPSTTTSYELV
jgi:hypothetical protein